MSNLPPKFYIADASDPTDSTVGVAEAWNTFDSVFLANRSGIIAVVQRIAAQSFQIMNAGKNVRFIDEAAALQTVLSAEQPEFVVATEGLKTAFDRVRGKWMAWNHWQRGDPIGYTESLLDERTIVRRVQRSDPTYPELGGYIVGHVIGPDPFLGGLNAWVNISPESTEGPGMHHSLFEMYAIRISEAPDD